MGENVVVPLDLDERARFAEESMRMAEELADYVFPPWRWLKWHRLAKRIRTRNAALREANALTRSSLMGERFAQ